MYKKHELRRTVASLKLYSPNGYESRDNQKYNFKCIISPWMTLLSANVYIGRFHWARNTQGANCLSASSVHLFLSLLPAKVRPREKKLEIAAKKLNKLWSHFALISFLSFFSSFFLLYTERMAQFLVISSYWVGDNSYLRRTEQNHIIGLRFKTRTSISALDRCPVDGAAKWKLMAGFTFFFDK